MILYIKTKIYITVSLLFVTFILLFYSTPTYGAGSVNVSLNFTQATYSLNERAELNVILDSGAQSVIAGTVDISYDATKLQLLDIENNSALFKGEVSASGGSGIVNITKYVTPIGSKATGNNLFSTIVFRTIGPGAATVQINPSTLLFSDSGDDTIWNTQQNPKTVTVLQSESSNIVTAISQSQEGQGVNDIASRFAVDPSQPSDDVQVEFPDRPIPVDATETTIENRFVSIKVVNGSGDPVSQARVTLNGNIIETDSMGIAGFDSVPYGVYDVVITEPGSDGETTRTSIDVREEGDPLDIQEFEFIVDDPSSTINPIYVFLLIVAGVILVTAGLLVYLHRKNTIYPQQPY